MPLIDQPLGGQHAGDLPSRHADMPQHAELAPPREHQRAESDDSPTRPMPTAAASSA